MDVPQWLTRASKRSATAAVNELGIVVVVIIAVLLRLGVVIAYRPAILTLADSDHYLRFRGARDERGPRVCSTVPLLSLHEAIARVRLHRGRDGRTARTGPRSRRVTLRVP
jgi:hypothetical protein